MCECSATPSTAGSRLGILALSSGVSKSPFEKHYGVTGINTTIYTLNKVTFHFTLREVFRNYQALSDM